MNLIFSFLKKIVELKYLFILILFFLWMIFLDTHSWLIHNELNNEINNLKAQKVELEKSIVIDKKTINILENKDSLEVFGRNNYNLKKENESIFFVEYKDSID